MLETIFFYDVAISQKTGCFLNLIKRLYSVTFICPEETTKVSKTKVQTSLNTVLVVTILWVLETFWASFWDRKIHFFKTKTWMIVRNFSWYFEILEFLSRWIGFSYWLLDIIWLLIGYLKAPQYFRENTGLFLKAYKSGFRQF